MIKNYIIERLSWVLLILVLEALVLLVSFLDAAVPFSSMLYIVFLSMLIFVVFFIIRYHKETRYYKNPSGNAESPFEKIASEYINSETQRLEQEAGRIRIAFEQEKDELLSWIHEVKTPLTAMSLMIDRLEDKKMKADLQHEWLRIHLLLDQQLHSRRIPSIENDLYIENTNLKTILFQEIRTLQTWCMQKGIGFDVALDVTDVLTDAKWAAFIIRQLLTNAVKYSEASDIAIRSIRKDGQTILEVEDFGRGIASQDLPRIFDKGFTSTVMHQDHAATGMGLYLAKKAAGPLLIRMEVTSKLGEGTTFTLTFPQRNEFVRITSM